MDEAIVELSTVVTLNTGRCPSLCEYPVCVIPQGNVQMSIYRGALKDVLLATERWRLQITDEDKLASLLVLRLRLSLLKVHVEPLGIARKRARRAVTVPGQVTYTHTAFNNKNIL